MDASISVTNNGRTARARVLIDKLFGELPAASPARKTAEELYRLFHTKPAPRDIQWILLRVPGSSHAERAERIGISKQWFSDLYTRKRSPGAELAERISELTGVPIEEVR